MKPATTFLRLLALCACAAPSLAQQRAPIDRARERWEQLSPDRRQELLERFEHWRSLSEDERARLRERYHQIETLRERCRNSLPEPVRRDLDQLEPEKQREVIHGVVAGEVEERGRAILDMMPPHWRERLERAPQAERPRVIEAFKKEMHERALERLERLARDHGLRADEVARLRELSPSELMPRLLELEQRRIVRDVEQRGLPPFVTPELWAQWKSLPAPRFFERWNEAKRRFGPLPPSEAGAPKHPERVRTARDERLRQVHDAMRLDPSAMVEMAKLAPEERREQIGKRVRERVLEVLARAPDLVDAKQLAALQKLDGREFFDALHRALPEVQLPGPMRNKPPLGEGLPGKPPAGGQRPPARPPHR